MTDPLTEWHRAAIAETMRLCREESREERAVKRALDAAFAPPVDSSVHKSTGLEAPERDTECA